MSAGTELFEVLDEHDHRIAVGLRGPLSELNGAGLLTAGDIRTAQTVCRLGGEDSPDVLLAVALLVRAANRAVSVPRASDWALSPSIMPTSCQATASGSLVVNSPLSMPACTSATTKSSAVWNRSAGSRASARSRSQRARYAVPRRGSSSN